MKILLLALGLIFSVEAFGEPYAIAGIAVQDARVDGGKSDQRMLPTLGAGYRIGRFAGEARCAADADCSVVGVLALPLGGHVEAIGNIGLHYLRGEITEYSSRAAVRWDGSPGIAVTAIDHRWSGWAPGGGVGLRYQASEALVQFLFEQTGGVDALKSSRSISAALILSF